MAKIVDPDGDGLQPAELRSCVYDNPSVVTRATEEALVGADHIVLEFRGAEPSDLRYRYLHGPAVDQVFAGEEVESF